MRLLTLPIVFILYCCKNNSASLGIAKIQLDSTKLYGRWTILDALRNNRPTQTITGAIFDIQPNQLTHNLLGTDIEYQYQIKDSTLLASDQTMYRIEYLNDSLLIINTLIQNHKFKMSLKKLPEQTPELTESDTLKQMQ